MWKCGCVFFEWVLKEVLFIVCNKCGKVFFDNDIVVINGSEDEVSGMRVKMEEKCYKVKLEKKVKKIKIFEIIILVNEEFLGISVNGES